MGEPAEMSRTEQTFTLRLAERVIAAVSDDSPTIAEVMRKASIDADATLDTLVLWLAQEVVRLRARERELVTEADVCDAERIDHGIRCAGLKP